MAFGNFGECVEGMQSATYGSISYLTYFLKQKGNEIDLSYNRDKVYGYLYDEDADKVVEKVIEKIALDVNNNVLVYFEGYANEYDYEYLSTLNVLNTFNIVKSLYEYPIE